MSSFQDIVDDLNESTESLRDGHEIPLEQYKSLPMDPGGFTDPGQVVNSTANGFFWDGHHAGFEGLMWLLNFIFSYAWADILVQPVQTISTAMQTMSYDIRIVFMGVAFAAAALVYGVAMLRGKMAHGLSNLAVTALLGALLLGIFSNPFVTVFGDGGWFDSMKTNGSQVAAQIMNDGDEDGELTADKALTDTMGKTYVDILVREPYQHLLFGKTLTGECEEVFNESLRDVVAGDSSDMSVREDVAACDEEAKFYSENASSQIDVMAGAGIMLASFFLVTLVIAAVMLIAFIGLLFQVAMLVWQLLLALLPGSDRAGFWKSITTCLVELVFVTTSVIVMVIHLKFTELIFKMLRNFGEYKYLVVALFTLTGIILIVLFRKWLLARGKNVAARIGSSLGSGGSSTSGPSSTQRAAAIARSAMGRTVHAASALSTHRTLRGAVNSSDSQGSSPAAERSAAQSAPASTASTQAPGGTSSRGGAKKVLGKAAKVAAMKVPGVAPAVAGASAVAAGARKAKQRTGRVQQYFMPENRTKRRSEALRARLTEVQEAEAARQRKVRQKLSKVEGQRFDHSQRSKAPVPEETAAGRRLQQRAERLNTRLYPKPGRTARYDRIAQKLKAARQVQQNHEVYSALRREDVQKSSALNGGVSSQPVQAPRKAR